MNNLEKDFENSYNKETKVRTCLICGTKHDCTWFGRHLKKSHGITQAEYTLKFKHNGIYPKCAHPLCNKDSVTFTFISEGFNKYCSKSCQVSHMMFQQWDDPNHKRNSQEWSDLVSNNLKLAHQDPNSGLLKPEFVLSSGRIRRQQNYPTPNNYQREATLYIARSKINSVVIKIGMYVEKSQRLDCISKTFDIIYSYVATWKEIADLEIELLDKTEIYFYFEKDRKSLVLNAGFSELRYTKVIPELNNILANHNMIGI